jgi:hypothetical protein
VREILEQHPGDPRRRFPEREAVEEEEEEEEEEEVGGACFLPGPAAVEGAAGCPKNAS